MNISLETSLGIQFGHGAVVLVYLKKLFRKIVLDYHEIISLPEGLPENERDSYWTKEISRITKQKDITAENVWIGLPRREALLRFMTLPASAEENLSEVVRYEVGKYISLPPDTIVYDFIILEKDTHAKTLKLLLSITKKEVFERYLALLDRAGIQPMGMEIGTTAVYNALFPGKSGEILQNTVGLISVDAACFETVWIQDAILRYSHCTVFDGQTVEHHALQVQKEVRKGFRAAFPSPSSDGPHGSADPPVVYMVGVANLDELAARAASDPDFIIRPLPERILMSHVGSMDAVPQSIAPGIGLALRGIRKVPCELNLLPQHARKKARKAAIYFSVVLFLVVILLSVSWGVSSIVKKRLVIRTIEQEIEAFKPEVLAIQKIQEQGRSVQEMITSIEKAQAFEDSNLAILKELSAIIPASVWLTNLRYFRNELQLSGYADSASDLIAILDGSSLFTSSEFTAPITRDPQGKESFKITTKIERE